MEEEALAEQTTNVLQTHRLVLELVRRGSLLYRHARPSVAEDVNEAFASLLSGRSLRNVCAGLAQEKVSRQYLEFLGAILCVLRKWMEGPVGFLGLSHVRHQQE